jgi:hypothetical protein
MICNKISINPSTKITGKTCRFIMRLKNQMSKQPLPESIPLWWYFVTHCNWSRNMSKGLLFTVKKTILAGI